MARGAQGADYRDIGGRLALRGIERRLVAVFDLADQLARAHMPKGTSTRALCQARRGVGAVQRGLVLRWFCGAR